MFNPINGNSSTTAQLPANITPPESPSTEKTTEPLISENYGRNMYDSRSAETITSGRLFSDMLKTIGALPDASMLLNQFFQHVGGNWNDPALSLTDRANIAANAERVLQHIDTLGGRHSTAGNGEIEGRRPHHTLDLATKRNTTYGESEARRLLDFCTNGYSIFSEAPPTQAPVKTANRPTHNTGRDSHDTRSADQITAGPLFEHLFPQSSGAGVPLLEGKRIESFYKQVGGNWNDPNLDADQKANIAANAERVLKYIDNRGGHHSTANNGLIEGTLSLRPKMVYDALNIQFINMAGSEARLLTNFSEQGYDALK